MSFKTAVNKVAHFLLGGESEEKKRYYDDVPSVAATVYDGKIQHAKSPFTSDDYLNNNLLRNEHGYTTYETHRYLLDKGETLKDGNVILKQQLRDLKRETLNDPNRERSTEIVTDRGFLDRIFGVLGYNGVAQGLYYATDDNEETTLGQGLLEGFKYMNPFENDVSGRKSMSDVLKNMGWEDEDPNKVTFSDVARGVAGFAGDVLTDPLSFINPFGAASKVVKGSGYGLDVVKALEKIDDTGLINKETIKSISKVADYLHDSGKTNFEKLQRTDFVKLDTFKEQLKKVGAYKEMPKEAFDKEAERLYKEFHERVMHVRFAEDTDEGFSVGLHHLPFMEKSAKSLKKTIFSNEALTKFGDKTISPYYNSLAKKLRTSRIGKKFNNNAIETNIANGTWIPKTGTAAYIIQDIMKGVQKAKLDADDIVFAEKLSEYTSSLTQEQVHELLDAIEKGALRDAVSYDKFRNRIVEMANGNTKNFDDLSSGEGIKAARNLSERYEAHNKAKRVVNANIEMEKANIEAAENELKAVMDRILSFYETTPQSNLFYSLFKELPSIAANDESVQKVYDIASGLRDVDVVKTLHKYLSEGKGNTPASKILEQLVINGSDGLDNFIIEKFNSFDADDIVDMFKNYSVKYGDTDNALEQIIRNSAAEKGENLIYAFNRAQETANNGFAVEAFDLDGVNRLLSKLPEGADAGEYLAKMLNSKPEIRRAMVDFAYKDSLSPETNNLFTRFQREMSQDVEISEPLSDILNKHKEAIYNSRKNLKGYEQDLANLTLEEEALVKEVEQYYQSDYFKTMREMEKFVTEPGLKTKFVQNIENIANNVEYMEGLERKLEKFKKAKEFFEGKDYVTGREDAKEVYEMLQQFEARMKDIGQKEMARGLLKEGQVDKHADTYVLHTPTEEGKEFFGSSDPDFKQTGSFKGKTGLAGKFDASRRSDMTITELNKYYKENYGVVQAFETDLANIYLARTLSSNQNLYAVDVVNFIKENFSRPLDTLLDGQKYHDLVEKDESIGVTYHDLSRVLDQQIKAYFREESKPVMKSIMRDLCQERLDEHVAAGRPRKLSDGEVTQLSNEAQRIFNREYSGEIRERVRNNVVSSFFDGDEKAVSTYAPNIPIQKLTTAQAERLYRESGIHPRKFNNAILEQVNVLSKIQKNAQQKWFTNLYDKFLHIWKLNNTLTAPSFHVQNLASNAFQSYLGIASDAMNPKKLMRSYNILKNRDPHQVFKCAAGEYTHKQLEHIAKEVGVIDEAFISADLGKGAKSIFENNVRKAVLPSFEDVKNIEGKTLNPMNVEKNVLYQTSTVVGTTIESTQRMNHFLSCLEQGMTIEEAARSVDDYLFNYSDLTNFEQETLKRIIPFYTFMRKNIPMQLDSILNRSQIYSTLDKAITNIDKMAGNNYVPENYRNQWRQEYIQLPFGEGRLGINPNLPYQQLERLEPETALRKLVGSTTPLVKVPLELLLEENVYTEMPIGNKAKYLFTQLGIIPTTLVRTGEAIQNKDAANVINNMTKFIAFPTAYVDNYAKLMPLSEEENEAHFNAVYKS